MWMNVSISEGNVEFLYQLHKIKLYKNLMLKLYSLLRGSR